MSYFKIIFIHGYTASSKVDFYPALSPLLDSQKIDYIIPNLPGYKNPRADEWLETIHKVLMTNTKPLIFVGHSLGTRAVLLYLEKYHPKSIKKVFLIASFADRLENASPKDGDAYPDFFSHHIDIGRVKKCAEKFYVLHSTDDPSIDYAQGAEIAKDLDAELLTFRDRSHFFKPENAPIIFEVLKEKIPF